MKLRERCTNSSIHLIILIAVFGLASVSATTRSAFADAEDGDEQNTLSESELANGWIQLFDGRTLFGWKQASQANWKVADGAIRVSDGDPGLLHTTTQFGDYQLKVDFRAARGTNSGIFLRTSPKPKNPAADCYELNITPPDESEFPTGSFVERKRGATVEADEAWHTYDITAVGGKFTVKLDGETVLQYEDEKPLGRGFIGLQFNHGAVAFRNVMLRPLGLAPIFNGRDLTGWKIYPDRQSKFSVTKDGELRILSGPGQLESEKQFADFVLQTEVFVNGKDLNSGIFFRSIPGDYSNGYESQIHNGIVDGDISKPANGGTGGIFRRQNARLVLARDFEWFHKTMVADDRHMAVWVGGVQVSDWTDGRDPDPNPRRGLRLEKGTFILQGHDPTTDISFRNMRVGEIPERR